MKMTPMLIALIVLFVAIIGAWTTLGPFDYDERMERYALMQLLLAVIGVGAVLVAVQQFIQSQEKPEPLAELASAPQETSEGFMQWPIRLLLRNGGNVPMQWYAIQIDLSGDGRLDIQRGPYPSGWRWLGAAEHAGKPELPVSVRYRSSGDLVVMDEVGEYIDGPEPIRLDEVITPLTVRVTIRTLGLKKPKVQAWQVNKDTGEIQNLARA